MNARVFLVEGRMILRSVASYPYSGHDGGCRLYFLDLLTLSYFVCLNGVFKTKIKEQLTEKGFLQMCK